MASDINGDTGVITVFQADMVLEQAGPPAVYGLDVNALRLELRAWEASEEGIVFPKTHDHNGEQLISGVTYARGVIILPPYTVTISPASGYIVNARGANHNIQDVLNNTTGPSFNSNNSAGNTVPVQPADVADAVWDEPRDDHTTPGTFGDPLTLKKTTEAPEIWKQEN